MEKATLFISNLIAKLKGSKPPDLPLHIWVEIFHKLPLVSVGRCLRVCNQWYLLISDPFFVSNYNPHSLRNHPISILMKCTCGRLRGNPPPGDIIFLNEAFKSVSNNGVTCFAKSKSLERRPFRSHCDFFEEGERRRRVSVLGICNGLVALYKSPGDFLLFNPFTKVEKRLQLDSDQSKATRDFFHSVLLCALYHDEARGDEYKVVISYHTASFRTVSLKDGSFTSKTQSQVLQNVKIFLINHGPPWEATMVRGVPHWVGDLRVGGVVIIYFDPLIEEFQLVRFPKERPVIGPHWGERCRFELGALDEQLTVSYELGANMGFEVWALKEYGDESSWSMLFVIPKACDTFQILSRVSDDEILVFGQYLKVYNIRTRGWRQLLSSNGLHHIMNYIPSLVSPNH